VTTRRVTIIHPWLPQYRVPFFEAAITELERRDIELTVAHGAPPPDVLDRRDAHSADWAVPLRTRTIRIRGRALLAHDSSKVVRGRDLVVAEHAIRNVETYRLAACAGASGAPRLALWGHGRTYTKSQTSLEQKVKARLTRSAHWFFAYTDGGARSVAAQGFPVERVTVVQNSIDTEHLGNLRAAVTSDRVATIAASLGLTRGRTALSIGALDSSKRLDDLVETGNLVAAQLPGFTLVLAGAGPLEAWVRQQASRYSWLRYVGPVFGREKAELAATADLMMITGRVGLVAVDSFALHLPIVTTRWALHAPEFEYLVDGRNAAVVADSVDVLADRVVELLRDSALVSALTIGCRVAAKQYTLAAMVDRFADGVSAALMAAPRQTFGNHEPGRANLVRV